MSLRYASIMGLLLFIFMSFIACGSQMYQVSLDEDFDQEKTPPQARDKASTQYGIHASDGWSALPIAYKFAQDMNDSQKAALQKAMRTWEKVTGKKLFKLNGIDMGKTGDSFPDLYSSLADGINGHYLDNNWKKTSKPVVVLATTIWDTVNGEGAVISGADIRFNAENYNIGDSLMLTNIDGKQIVDMESLALHELGHLLGLAHVDADHDPASIMNPRLYIGEGLTSRKVSRGDIERIQQIYNCDGAACDIEQLVMDIEQNAGTITNTPDQQEDPQQETSNQAH